MTRLDDLRSVLAPLGLTVDTWSPGDGMTRYKFLPIGKEYFSDRGIATVFGFKDADLFTTGLVQGFEIGKKVGKS